MTRQRLVLLRRIALTAGAVTALGLAGCKSGTFSNHYNTAQEVKMGQEYSNQVETQSRMDLDPVENARVQRIAKPIFEQARLLRPDVVYSIKIIDSREVNAFSLPGGWVYVYTGLLDKIGNDDDALACVIGHESSHVVFRHAVKQISDAEAKGLLVNILGATTNNYNLYNGATALYELDQLHYSREDEYQADKYGLMFAYNAGYDPYGMPRFFAKLQQLEKVNGAPPAYELDHPLTKTRILRANQLITELRQNDGKYPEDANTTPAPKT